MAAADEKTRTLEASAVKNLTTPAPFITTRTSCPLRRDSRPRLLYPADLCLGWTLLAPIAGWVAWRGLRIKNAVIW